VTGPPARDQRTPAASPMSAVGARPWCSIRVIALGAFVLAFAVRLAWVLCVQSPLDAVYSDMEGYVERAQELLFHITPADPRVSTIYPFGTHYLLALQFLVLGRDARVANGILQALLGAVPAPCMVALTGRMIPGRLAPALVGALVALWYPQVCFTGFFLSEVWFSAAIALQAWLAVSYFKRPYGLLADGFVSAIAFVVRPQFVVTWALQVGARAFSLVRYKRLGAAPRTVFWLAIPMIATVIVSVARFHRLTGHFGLISENANINRVWAETDICKLEATWRTPNGEMWTYWFNPPSKTPHKPSDAVHVDGYIADADILGEVRAERLRGVPWSARLSRRLWDVKLLVTENLPWPESNYQDDRFRVVLQKSFAAALVFGVLPLGALGIALGRRNRTMMVFLANLVTPIIAAALYFGEARYHVPYDPFALLLAVVGCYELGRILAFVQRKMRLRAAGLREAEGQ
jgi:hypothetical protein